MAEVMSRAAAYAFYRRVQRNISSASANRQSVRLEGFDGGRRAIDRSAAEAGAAMLMPSIAMPRSPAAALLAGATVIIPPPQSPDTT